MLFEQVCKSLNKNEFVRELSKHFYNYSNVTTIKIPKDVLQEREKWVVSLILNNDTLSSFLTNLTYDFNSEGLKLVKGTGDSLLEFTGSEKEFRIVFRRVEYKKSNPIEDKIKMLQEQIDELKKQVVL
jgi:hypothetical protein